MSELRDALAWVYALEPRGIRYELERVRQALALIGDPDRGLPTIHIAGTNGKGSVAAMVERGLRASGLRTGLFTSPHLHRFAERVRIAGRPLSDIRVARGLCALRERFESPGAPQLTFFEITFLLAIQAFRAAKVDVVVLETGLGGRLDATNAVRDVDVSTITTLSLDHTDLLGPTIEDIAHEKAGIIRSRTPLVCGVENPVARAIVLGTAARLGAPVVSVNDDAALGAFRPALAGTHQRLNASLAVATLETFSQCRGHPIGPDAVRAAVERVCWPGRLEALPARGRRPAILLDAAHNHQGALALAAHVATMGFAADHTALVLGAQPTKDVVSMLGAIAPIAAFRFYVPAPVRRSADPRALAAILPGETHERIEDALRAAARRVGRAGLVVVAGSIFVMGRARERLLRVRCDPPISM